MWERWEILMVFGSDVAPADPLPALAAYRALGAAAGSPLWQAAGYEERAETALQRWGWCPAVEQDLAAAKEVILEAWFGEGSDGRRLAIGA